MADRRKQGERKLTDRRVIERITNTRLRENYTQIRSWVRALLLLSVVYASYQFIYGFYVGGNQVGIGILNASLFIFIATYLYGYQSQISLFLENESVKNLENTVEKAQGIWVGFVFFTALLFIIEVLTHI